MIKNISFLLFLVSIPFVINAWNVFHFRKPFNELFKGKITKVSFILSVIIFFIRFFI